MAEAPSPPGPMVSSRLTVGVLFPLGMYAASSLAVGVAAHAGAITNFARVWVWIALGAWLIVFVSAIGRAVEVVRGQRPGEYA